MLVITQDTAGKSSDYILSYRCTSSTTSGTSDVMLTGFNNMTEHIAIIGSARTGNNASDEYMQNNADYINGIYGHTVEGVIANSVTDTAISITADMVFSEMAEGTGLLKLGKVPVIDIVTGIAEIPLEISEMQQGLSDNQKIVTLGNTTTMAKDFDMNISFIKLGDAQQTYAVVTPGPETAEIIENINKYIEVNNIDMGKYDLPQTLTLEIIKDNPNKMYELIEVDIRAIEFDKYGTETHVEASLVQLVGEGHLPTEILFGDK